MSKQANKTLIGAFVVGAVALVVVALMVFGSGKLFAPTKKYVMFFEGSVKGLNIGSPVIFRGVKIGEVTNIQLELNPKDMSAVIPVYIEIDQRLFSVPDEFKPMLKETGKYLFIKPLIEKGLKAQLQMQSFVTGQLMINLDFYPDKPVRLVGHEKKYPEIPTVPTSLEALAQALHDLPLKDIIMKLDLAVDGIQKIVNSPDTQEGITSLNLTLKDTRKLVQDIDRRIDPMMESLTKTSDTAHDTFVQGKSTLTAIEVEAKELTQSIKSTIETADATLKQAEKTLSAFSGESRLVYELNNTLTELSGAARSLRVMSEYLEQHPEALLTGKKRSGGE